MRWDLLSTQLKDRVRRPWFIYPSVAGIITFVVNLLLVINSNIKDSNEGRFWVLFIVAGILFAIGAIGWWTISIQDDQETYCKHCSFDLRGHSEIPTVCPECGGTPTPLTVSHDQANVGCVALLPGCIPILLAIGCFLIALLFYVIWDIRNNLGC